MSITDMAAGRMAQGPVRTFGARRVPPMPARPRPQPALSVLWQDARKRWPDIPARLQRMQHRLFSLTWLSQLLRWASHAFRAAPGLILRRAKSAAAAIRPATVWLREAAIHALLYSNASATFIRLLAYLGVLIVLALLAEHLMRSAPAIVDSAPQAPQVEWISVAKPFPAFSLPLSELGDGATGYALRRHAAGGGRQDTLTWGELESGAPHLTVEIYRPGRELLDFGSAAREIAARLNGIDVAAIKPAGTLESKFGDVALMEFPLPDARQCLGFVRIYDDPQLQILGWHCTSGDAPDRELTACALDRLSLLSAGSDPKLRELFARAELKRNFCGQRSHLLTPTPRLGPSLPPPEHGRVAAR